MNAEPGSCDLFTTGEDPDPLLTIDATEERTPSGWILRHERISHRGFTRRGSCRTKVIHPWLGTMAVFIWSIE